MSIADELITRGWCQGTSIDDDGRVCLVGAVYYAGPNQIQMLNAISAAIGCGPGRVGQIGVWNDAPSRTFDEVLRVAKEADEILDGQA